MNAKLHKIMIIDDSPSDIHVLLDVIGEEYQVSAATSAEQGFELIQKGERPDVILMDINMPGMDGYSACTEIKQNVNFKNIEIMFVSSNDSTDEIIRGIDAGAIAFIIKPFDPNIVKSKIRRVIDHTTSKAALMQEAENANKLVYSVMNEAGHMGVVLNFLRDTIRVRDSAALLDKALNALSSSGLDGIVFFKKNDIEEMGSNGKPPGFLELDLIDRVFKNHSPLIEQDNHLMVSRDNVVIYIKNLPNDPTKSGTFKDSLMILIEAINAKLNALWSARLFENQRLEIKKVIAHAKAALTETHVKQAQHKQKSIEILDNMVTAVEGEYFAMGLTDQQEITLTNLMQRAVDESLDHFDMGTDLDLELTGIIDALAKIARNK